ncbi:transmembrane protein 72 [Hemicordylus capensis]|uniref:transmembrane protein 72 n=1 Tax=Hemicordylus capensis TaxID=884348 RepID=UPI002304756F|nr:transmembrane protein 72 [Hemicordylus capensis]
MSQVLIGVGTDTLLQGQFKSLAIYLLFSGIAISVCEAAYFASLLLTSCSISKMRPMVHTCWKQARRRGAFQKFLAYLLLSVACFLHPVIVWHVTIPGAMLVLTGLAYFLLSKQQNKTAADGTQGQYSDPCSTAVTMMGADDTAQTYTFPREARRGQHRPLFGCLRSILKGGKKQEAVMNSSPIVSSRRQRHLEEKTVNIILSVKENAEEPESLAEENTSDTAPILAPQV